MAKDSALVTCLLGRVLLDEKADRHFLELREKQGPRRFTIVIGTPEAAEIHRLVTGLGSERPLTHELMHRTLQAVGCKLVGVDVVDLRQNTFFARLRVEAPGRDEPLEIDARPSDAIALAIRARCPLRVAEKVLAAAAREEEAEREADDEADDEPDDASDD